MGIVRVITWLIGVMNILTTRPLTLQVNPKPQTNIQSIKAAKGTPSAPCVSCWDMSFRYNYLKILAR